MKQHYNTGTKVDNTNIVQYAKSIKRGSGDRIWNTEQLLNRLDKAGVRYTVKNSKSGRVISVDKNAYNNNSDIRRYYDDRNRLYNDSIDASKTKRVFSKTTRKALDATYDLVHNAEKKFKNNLRGGSSKYRESIITLGLTNDEEALSHYEDDSTYDHIEQTSGMTEESGSLLGKAEFMARGGIGFNKIPQKLVELNKSTGNDVAANKHYQKYKKLVRDNIIQGRGFDLNRDAQTDMVDRDLTANLSLDGRQNYSTRIKMRFPATSGDFMLRPKDSLKLVDFENQTQVNTNELSNQTLEDNNRQDRPVSDMRNKVAAQKTFSKPKEEESKAPKFTSIGRSSMGNMLELYNEKGNVVESMSPTAKNVRRVMKHLGVGDDNSSDDDVKTWFKDFSKQTDKGKRITFNTTSKKK